MLKFEEFTQEHIPYYYAWRNDPTVAIFDQSEFLRPRSMEEVETWAQRLVEGYTYTVLYNEKPIGTIALMNVDTRNRHAELAIMIGDKSKWSKGLGTEMLTQLLSYGFEGLNLRKLYLHVFDFNKRAIGLYEKFGFKKEGTKKEMVYRGGKYHDVHFYALFKNDYIKRV